METDEQNNSPASGEIILKADVLRSNCGENERKSIKPGIKSCPVVKPKRGAPFNNTNAFKNGSTIMQRVRTGKRKRRSAREGEIFAQRLVQDLGGEASISMQQWAIIELCGRDWTVLDDMEREKRRLLRTRPKLRQNLSALAKIDSYIAPVANRLGANLMRLGLKKVNRIVSLEELLNQHDEKSFGNDGRNKTVERQLANGGT